MDGPPPDDVRLRDATHDDLPIFYEHQRDPVASRMAAFASRDLDAFMEHWTSRILENETGVAKTVLVGGRVAGNILAFDHDGRREIGYWIGREFWGRGVATRALAAFLVEVTERPLYAGVARHNLASIRVLEKNGFEIADQPVEPAAGGIEELLLRLEA